MGKLFILSAPSGTGKSTVTTKLLSGLTGIKKVITATTRDPRPGEVNRRDYIFMTREEFERGIKEGFFLEYAEVYGNLYGTPADQVRENLLEGTDSLLVIDVQGAFKVKKAHPDAVSIFLMPPSLEELKRRMKRRGHNDANSELRLRTAREEIPCAREFDYIVINDFIDRAVEHLKSIIISHRCQRDRVIKESANLLDDEIVSLLEGGRCHGKET